MNDQTTHEFLEKMIQSKQLEKEALLTLLPDHVKGHLSIIEKEVKAMIIDLLSDVARDKETTTTSKDSTRKTHVNKVNID